MNNIQNNNIKSYLIINYVKENILFMNSNIFTIAFAYSIHSQWISMSFFYLFIHHILCSCFFVPANILNKHLFSSLNSIQNKLWKGFKFLSPRFDFIPDSILFTTSNLFTALMLILLIVCICFEWNVMIMMKINDYNDTKMDTVWILTIKLNLWNKRIPTNSNTSKHTNQQDKGDQ